MWRMTLIIVMLISCYALRAQSIRIVSYNFQHGSKIADGKQIDSLVAMINNLQPDILALQEVDSGCASTGGIDMMKKIGEITGMKYCYGRTTQCDSGSTGNAILSKFQISSVKNTLLPHRPTVEITPGYALECIVSIDPDHKFKVVSTELDTTRGTPDRIMQADKLYALYFEEKHPFILAGSLNVDTSGTSLHMLLEMGMELDKENNTPTFPADSAIHKYDYILFSKKAQWSNRLYSVEKDVRYSNHLPVLCVINLQ
ncbi:MAG: hypothetical protein C5B52_05540 [Bacteroidetes bacterium]|nr:MAG: hypothetical protein C5B52_05540 [Bacteroidota bacterium]